MSVYRSRAGFVLRHDGQKTPCLGVLMSEGSESAEYSKLPIVKEVVLRNDGQQWTVVEYNHLTAQPLDDQAKPKAAAVVADHYVPDFRVRRICVDAYNNADVDADGYSVEFDIPFAIEMRRRFQAQVDYEYWVTRVHLGVNTATSIEIHLLG